MTHDYKRHGTTALLAAMNALEALSGSFLAGIAGSLQAHTPLDKKGADA